MTIDLSSLPAPSVIEELDYATLYANKLAAFQALNPDYESFLDSDPIVKFVQHQAYEELLLRARVNEGARSQILAYATGTNLDHLASFYEVTRLVVQEEDLTVNPPVEEILESDEALRLRIQETAKGGSNAGSKASYRAAALGASALVKDVSISSSAGGVVDVTVLSTEGDGVPDASLLSTVDAVMQADDVKVFTDTVNTLAATKVDFAVEAEIKLLTGTPQAVYDALEANFTTAFTAFKGLNIDVPRSWIIGQLQASGVHSVSLSSPASDVVIDVDEFPNLSSITLTQGASTT